MKATEHLREEDLLLCYYSEAESGAAGHLEGCAECRGRLEELSKFLATIVLPREPERGEQYGNEVWNAIRAHLPEKAPTSRWSFGSFRAWGFASAMAALLVVAFLAGRFLPRGGENIGQPGPIANKQQPISQNIRERVILLAVGDHLDRSQMLLIELMNAPEGQKKVDFTSERERAGELLNSSRLYRQAAQNSGDMRVAGLLDQLERVLLQISHDPDEISDAELNRLQRQIQEQGLLFKVRVVRSNVRQRSRNAQADGQEKNEGKTKI